VGQFEIQPRINANKRESKQEDKQVKPAFSISILLFQFPQSVLFSFFLFQIRGFAAFRAVSLWLTANLFSWSKATPDRGYRK
jgi:hypothetical protein